MPPSFQGSVVDEPMDATVGHNPEDSNLKLIIKLSPGGAAKSRGQKRKSHEPDSEDIFDKAKALAESVLEAVEKQKTEKSDLEMKNSELQRKNAELLLKMTEIQSNAHDLRSKLYDRFNVVENAKRIAIQERNHFRSQFEVCQASCSAKESQILVFQTQINDYRLRIAELEAHNKCLRENVESLENAGNDSILFMQDCFEKANLGTPSRPSISESQETEEEVFQE